MKFEETEGELRITDEGMPPQAQLAEAEGEGAEQ